MMGFWNGGYEGYRGMMGGGSIVMFLFMAVIFIDLVLLGIWLWKQIKK